MSNYIIPKEDFDFMLHEAKQISISNFVSAENGLYNLHNEYFDLCSDSFKNEVRSQISKVYQVTDEMIKTLAQSILHKKAKVFFPEQKLDSWSINFNNIDEIMYDYSKDCHNAEICKEVYDNNLHLFRALQAGLVKLTELMTNEYEELKEEHKFHTEYVDDCEECLGEYIDDSREVAGLHRDYERMCK